MKFDLRDLKLYFKLTRGTFGKSLRTRGSLLKLTLDVDHDGDEDDGHEGGELVGCHFSCCC